MTFTRFLPLAGRGPAVAVLLMGIFMPVNAGNAEPIASEPSEYRARIVEIYGDKAIVEIDSRRFLVEAIEPGKPFPADVGSDIRIEGRSRGNVLVPSRITLPSGSTVQRAAEGAGQTPGQDRSIEGQLRDHGITVVGRPYRRRNFTVVEGRGEDGRRVIAVFDSSLRLEEIEEAEHRRHIHPRSPEALSEPEVARLLAGQGYSSIRLIGQNRFQFLYSVTNAKGQQMELQVDRGGNILRRVWLR